MKKDLIIIPGAVNPRIANYSLIKPLVKFIRVLIKITPEITFRYDSFMDSISSSYNKIHFINYKRELFGVLKKSNIETIADKLSEIKNDYDVVCFSFGGYLIQEALKNKNLRKPNKLILMFSINLDKKHKFPDRTKVFNIYSTKDFLIKSTIFLLSLGRGNQHLENANNITLDNMHHSDVEGSKVIEYGLYKGLTGFGLVQKILNEPDGI